MMLGFLAVNEVQPLGFHKLVHLQPCIVNGCDSAVEVLVLAACRQECAPLLRLGQRASASRSHDRPCGPLPSASSHTCSHVLRLATQESEGLKPAHMTSAREELIHAWRHKQLHLQGSCADKSLPFEWQTSWCWEHSCEPHEAFLVEHTTQQLVRELGLVLLGVVVLVDLIVGVPVPALQ